MRVSASGGVELRSNKKSGVCDCYVGGVHVCSPSPTMLKWMDGYMRVEERGGDWRIGRGSGGVGSYCGRLRRGSITSSAPPAGAAAAARLKRNRLS